MVVETDEHHQAGEQADLPHTHRLYAHGTTRFVDYISVIRLISKPCRLTEHSSTCPLERNS